MIDAAGPWGTGPYKLVEGFSLPNKRSDRVVLEANTEYWDKRRFPRLARIVFDNILSQEKAVQLVKTGEGRVDLVTELSPLETLRVAESPFASVVKGRSTLVTVFGLFNMRKVGNPWRNGRLRQAVNLAVNRPDLVRYATKGNGLIIPALVPTRGFGFDPDLAPYPFDPAKARALLREAGYSEGLAITLIAPESLNVQATVVSMMLEQVGLAVDLQVLSVAAYNRRTFLDRLDRPADEQTWDIALVSFLDPTNFAPLHLYHIFAVDGRKDWVVEQPELRRLYEQALGTVDRERQRNLIRQMERHTRDEAYFLFLYDPIQLYAVNKAVNFVPHATGILQLAETSLTEQHWSVRAK